MSVKAGIPGNGFPLSQEWENTRFRFASPIYREAALWDRAARHRFSGTVFMPSSAQRKNYAWNQYLRTKIIL